MDSCIILSLNQFFSNGTANDNGNAAESYLDRCHWFCDTDYWVPKQFDARVAQGTTYGPCLYIEYVARPTRTASKTGYSYDLPPVGGHFNEGLAKLNYTAAVKNFSGGSGISILETALSKTLSITKSALTFLIMPPKGRYYANLEKLLMTFDSMLRQTELSFA